MSNKDDAFVCDFVFLFPGKTFSIDFLNSWTNSILYLNKKGSSFASIFKSGSIIQELRNQLVAGPVVDEEGTVLEKKMQRSSIPFSGTVKPKRVVFIDSDMVWNLHALNKILYTDADIVCAPYRTEVVNQTVIASLQGGYMTADEIQHITEPFEILAGGMGFVSVKYEVLEKIGFPWFNTVYYKDENTGEIEFAGEDSYFFFRAKEEGFTVMCDPNIFVGHEKSSIMEMPKKIHSHEEE
jgi:hypothetical protein